MRPGEAESTSEVHQPGRRPRRPFQRADPGVVVILAAFAFFAVAFTGLGVFAPHKQHISGVDPVGYYAWVHSLLFDGDFDFENEYRTLNAGATFTKGFLMNPDGAKTATHHLPNLFSLGPGLLWSPFIVMAHGYARLAGAPADGFSQPYQSAVFFANAVYGLLGILLTYALLRTWFTRWTSVLAALAAWTCSPALYYTFAQIAMAHACSFFAVALFLCTWARLREKPGLWPWMAIGAALGLAALVRWQNAAFGIVPAIDLLARKRLKGILPLAVCALASIVTFTPQMAAWKIVYGSFVTVPQGSAFINWTRPDVAAVFFSRASGLLTWTPFCAVGIVGLFVWPRNGRVAWIGLAAALCIQICIDSVVPAAGWSFGMRRLVNCTPLFAVGITQLIRLLPHGKRWLGTAAAAFAFWNFLFILQYGGFIDSFYAQRAAVSKAAELHVPVSDLLRMKRLPDGQPFDLRQFVQEHCFPRGKDLSLRQFTVDKLVVIRYLIERLSPSPPAS